MGEGRIINANGVGLCVESFGDPADPGVLLIMGSGASMDWWPGEFCERLAAGRRFVIRYDHRDTGRSVSYEPGAPGYSGEDLAEDAASVIPALGLERAALVGMSMGGGIAQVVALDHPDRVSSLTLIATAAAVSGPDAPAFVQMSEETGARYAAVETPDWADRAAVIDYIVALERVGAGSRPFPEAEWRELAGRALDRTSSIEAFLTNHNLIEDEGRTDSLANLRTPTLVIHGTEDPVLPYPNAVGLADAIPDARLITVDGMGHEVARVDWDLLVPAILEHTAGEESRR